MRRKRTHPARRVRGRYTMALTLLAGLLLAGPMQGESAASLCGSPSPRPATQSVAALVTEGTGVPLGVEATQIRWVRWHTRVVYGDTAVLEGQVVTEDGAIPDATVDLLAREAGSDEWSPIASTSTDPDTGIFSFDCLRPRMTTEYQAVYEGTLFYKSSQDERAIGVARRVPDAMNQVASDRFRFEGLVEPGYAGRPVLLQRKDCSTCRWRTIARRDTSSRSAWWFTIDVSGFTGSRWFRAVVPADERYVLSFSARTWRLTNR